MAEGIGLPGSVPHEVQRPKTSIVSKLVDILRKVASATDPETPKIPLEKITAQRVAETILNRVNNSSEESERPDRWERGFGVQTVLQQMGYFEDFRHRDFQMLYPDEFRATHQAILSLSHKGAIDIATSADIETGKPPVYMVVNEAKLKEVATTPQETKQP